MRFGFLVDDELDGLMLEGEDHGDDVRCAVRTNRRKAGDPSFTKSPLGLREVHASRIGQAPFGSAPPLEDDAGPQGQRRPELAFFLSDKGLLWGEHGIVNKLVPYRESIRVPLFVRRPGHIGSGTRTDIAATIDIAPTVYDALGLSPYTTDGRSLLAPTGRSRILIEQ